MALPADWPWGLRQRPAWRKAAFFLSWWTDELAALVPQSLRRRFSAGAVVMLRRDPEGWVELQPADGVLVERSRASRTSGAVGSAALERMLAPHRGSAVAWLVLEDDKVLRRRVELPLAAEESLRDTLGFELDRFTPFGAAQACFDHRVVARDEPSQKLEVELAVAERKDVEEAIRELSAAGASVAGVGVSGDLARSSAPLNLLDPDQRRRPGMTRSQLVSRVLAVLAVLLLAAVAIYPLWQKRSRVIEILPRMSAAKVGADTAERLGRDIEALVAEHNFIVGRKHGQYPASLLLEDLSRLLPDNTWVQQLEVKPGPKGRDLQIFGETGSSSQLIEVLEKSGVVANATFRSPLTKGVTPGTERFFVGAEISARPLPEALPDVAATATALQPPATSPSPPASPATATPPTGANPTAKDGK